MAWEEWQSTAAEMARQQFMLAGALNRMLKRALSAGTYCRMTAYCTCNSTQHQHELINTLCTR